MDEDDWDLHAVVRGYTATATATAAVEDDDYDDDPFPSLSMAPVEQASRPDFSFSHLESKENPSFQGLQEIYGDFYVDPPPPLPVPRVSHAQVVVENQLLGSCNPNSFPTGNPPPSSRPRRRKTQTMKMVRELTQEELAADSWAWRKYGQKPIKGSSYPRSYYRCSTSKYCVAKKHVERSPNDPSLFLVSYTGEHSHPRPAQRSTPSAKAPHSPGSASNLTAEAQNGGAAPPEQTVLNGMIRVANGDELLLQQLHHPHPGDDLLSSAVPSSPPPPPPPPHGGGEEKGLGYT